MPTVENVGAKMTQFGSGGDFIAAISDDGAANKMAQMGSIFPDAPPHPIRGDEEEKITLQREGAIQRVRSVPQSHRGPGRSSVAVPGRTHPSI